MRNLTWFGQVATLMKSRGKEGNQTPGTASNDSGMELTMKSFTLCDDSNQVFFFFLLSLLMNN